MKRSLLSIFISISLLLAGCETTSQKLFLESAASPNLPTPTQSEAATPTPSPVPTATPTLALIPSPTVTSTPLPTLTPTPSSTPAYIPEAGWTSTSISPDGHWEVYVYSGKFPAVTRIYRSDGGAFWEIVSNPYEFYDEHSAPINVYFTPFYWRSDKPYLYLAGQSCCLDGLPQFNSGFDLVQLDLTTGQSVTYIYGTPTRSAYVFSFSPDDRRMLIYNVKAHSLALRSLASYSQQAIDIFYTIIQTGAAAWAPDGRQVVFQACRSLSFQYIDCGSGLLVLVDLKTLQTRVIVEDTNAIPGRENPVTHPVFKDMFWIDGAHLLVTDSLTENWVVEVPSGRVEQK
jgi:hypothetical protein